MQSLFSVHDNKAQYYMPPQTYRTVEEAIRAFRTACEQKDSQFNVHGGDFTLVRIANWDMDSGEINPIKPELLANGADFTNNSEEA